MQEYIDAALIFALFIAMLVTAYVTGGAIERENYKWACVNFFIALYWLLRLAVIMIKYTFINT